jgi:hypothetical protein
MLVCFPWFGLSFFAAATLQRAEKRFRENSAAATAAPRGQAVSRLNSCPATKICSSSSVANLTRRTIAYLVIIANLHLITWATLISLCGQRLAVLKLGVPLQTFNVQMMRATFLR